jgi:rare lipoprotein A
MYAQTLDTQVHMNRFPSCILPTLLVAALGTMNMFCGGCGKRPIRVKYLSGDNAPKSIEREGIASWYGDPYHGRRTTNGEVYDKNGMTAAHRTLPFNTMVKVHNLENGKDVKVRINDRGPFVKDRIIDLSFAAAKKIAMLASGTARVRINVLKSAPEEGYLTIQVGAFRDKANAEALRTQVASICSYVAIASAENSDGTLYRVRAGKFSDVPSAAKELEELKARKYDGFIVRMDP